MAAYVWYDPELLTLADIAGNGGIVASVDSNDTVYYNSEDDLKAIRIDADGKNREIALMPPLLDASPKPHRTYPLALHWIMHCCWKTLIPAGDLPMPL